MIFVLSAALVVGLLGAGLLLSGYWRLYRVFRDVNVGFRQYVADGGHAAVRFGWIFVGVAALTVVVLYQIAAHT